MKFYKILLLGFFFFKCPLFINAQNFATSKYEIKWLKNISLSGISTSKNQLFNFEGVIYNGDHSPVFFASLKNMVFEEVKDQELLFKKDFPTEIVVISDIAYEKKVPYGIVKIIPVRINKNTGALERLVSFELEIKVNSQMAKQATATRYYSPVSVLKNNTCYKIGVTEDGIFKLTDAFLKQLGVSPGTIDPRNIHIYGNGGGLLSNKNSDFRYDDLVENSIYVFGEADGVFDKTDYVLFYGQGPNRWKYNQANKMFEHKVHYYTDTTYYFISFDGGAGKRIVSQASMGATPTNTVTSFDDYYYHEENTYNLIKSGREWFGEQFDILTTRDFNFSIPNVDKTVPATVLVDVIAQSHLESSFNVKANQTDILTIPIPASGAEFTEAVALGPGAGIATSKGVILSSADLQVSLTYNKSTSTSVGWLNYIEINARRNLTMSGNQMIFRDQSSVGANKISQFVLSNSLSNTLVWDVTDPLNVKKQEVLFSGSQLNFITNTDTLKQFVAFNSVDFKIPGIIGKVESQNLHGISKADLVIITHPLFLKEANRLADYHRTRDSLLVQVVTVAQIYNEFSSGCQDITALRDFMKMLYDRAGNDKNALPKSLLLFGDASYNYKAVSGNSNFVPSYESLASLLPIYSFVTDDYFGYLDDYEGVIQENLNPDKIQLLDLNIGRFPVQTVEQSASVVDKIIHYSSVPGTLGPTNTDACYNQSASNSSFGEWRNYVTFVAEGEDGNVHMLQADSTSKMLSRRYHEYNMDKIFLDAYKQISTPGGKRLPEAKADILKRIEKGSLIINYTGHGSELGWAKSRVLEIADIESWTNFNNLPLFMTATCEFSRYDNPERFSAGELVLLKKNGGGIALLTTVRLVYSETNFTLNLNFYQNVFNPIGSRMPTLGEIYTKTKNDVGGNHNFTLLGDPAMTLAYPTNKLITTSINNKIVSTTADTLRALSKVTIAGSVTDPAGKILTNFNGIVYPTIFDKPELITNLGNNDPPGTKEMVFGLQKNVLYKGKVSVTNGNFSFSFLIPKDISYQYGNGKISYYTENGTVDGNGFFDNIIIGGSPKNAISDTKGPTVRMFLNDEKFVQGGSTDETPIIKAIVSDSSGINTVGNGIGHDITAILDGDASHVLVLNDYYQTDLNSYQHGKISYKLARMKEGKHTLKLKIWDVYNNSSESYLDFVVTNSAEFSLSHVLNYPNPFTTKTSFYFEHNKPCTPLDVQIQVYTLSGKLIKTIDENRIHADGYRIGPIDWDGRDDFGDKIARGLYVYRIKVRSLSDGSIVDKYEKLVILN
jgi:hypothetical protein